MGPGAVPASHPLDAGTALRGIGTGRHHSTTPSPPGRSLPGGPLFLPLKPAHPAVPTLAAPVTQM